MKRIALAVLLGGAPFLAPGPAMGQIQVIGASVQERNTVSGERYVGQVRLQNNGAEARPVRVYQTDYVFYADGTNLYPSPGTQDRSNAPWITITPTDLVVPPGEDVNVSYEVAVPADPDLAGTYWSMVMVEPLPTEAERDPTEPGVGLQTTVRFGIQVATHVGEPAPHDLQIEETRVTTDPHGVRHLELNLVNTGEVAYRPNVSVEIYDETGSLASSLEDQRGLLYPGTSAVQRVSLEGLPEGTYQAVVVVDTGALDLFGGQFTLTLGTPD